MNTARLTHMFRLVLLLSALALFAGCGGGGGSGGGGEGGDGGSPQPTSEELSSQLKTLTQPEGINTGATQALKDTKDGDPYQDPECPDTYESIDGGKTVISKTYFQKYQAAATFDQLILLNPGTDVIYPGSVLLGHTIADGSYMEMTKGTKKKVTISYDLTGVKTDSGTLGTVSGTIVPTLSNFRELHNAIMSQQIPPQSNIYTYEVTDARTQEEFDLKFKVGAGYKSPGIELSIKAGFDYSKNYTMNRYMVKFMQTFYTVDINQEGGTFLYENFNIDDFLGYRPVYIASVAYGRLAYLTLESTKDWSEIKAQLNIVANSTAYNADSDCTTAMNWLTQNTKLNITVIGSDGKNYATDIQGFDQFLQEGGFSSTNSGKIISYKLRFVDDNSVAKTIFNGNFTVRSVEQTVMEGVVNKKTIRGYWREDGDPGYREWQSDALDLDTGETYFDKTGGFYYKIDADGPNDKFNIINDNTMDLFLVYDNFYHHWYELRFNNPDKPVLSCPVDTVEKTFEDIDLNFCMQKDGSLQYTDEYPLSYEGGEVYIVKTVEGNYAKVRTLNLKSEPPQGVFDFVFIVPIEYANLGKLP